MYVNHAGSYIISLKLGLITECRQSPVQVQFIAEIDWLMSPVFKSRPPCWTLVHSSHLLQTSAELAYIKPLFTHVRGGGQVGHLTEHIRGVKRIGGQSKVLLSLDPCLGVSSFRVRGGTVSWRIMSSDSWAWTYNYEEHLLDVSWVRSVWRAWSGGCQIVKDATWGSNKEGVWKHILFSYVYSITNRVLFL